MSVVWCKKLISAALALVVTLVSAAAQDGMSALVEKHRANPTDWKLCNQIAVAYTQAQDFPRAAEYYRKVLALNPSFVPARKNLAVVLWFAGRKAEAEPIFAQVARTTPNDPVPHLYLGLARYERKQYRTANAEFTKAGDLASKNPEVLAAVVDSRLASGDASTVQPAIEFARVAGDAQLAKQLAEALNRHGRFSDALVVLESARPADAGVLLLRAQAHDGAGSPDAAYRTLAQAVNEFPDEERVYTALASFSALHQNNKFGVEALSKGLQRLPKSGALLVSRGLLVALEGDRDKAAQDFQSAAAADQSWSLPALALGVLQLESGEIPAAMETFRSAVQRFPQESLPHYFTALALTRSADSDTRATAIAALRKALAIAPDLTRARVLLGRTYLSTGRLQDAIAALEQALKDDPSNLTARYQLSLAYRKAGKTAAADREMEVFRASKAKADEEASELVQMLKIVR